MKRLIRLLIAAEVAMSERERDDLFDNSTMTFGEHLDELRTTLAKSLVGLVIGFLLALPFANSAVRFVSSPLERALSRVHVQKTTEELERKGADSLDPESWPLVTDKHLIPSEIRMDVDGLVSQLARHGILDKDQPSSSAAFSPTEFTGRLASDLARALVNSNSWMASEAGKKCWELLKEPEQKDLVRIADAATTTPADVDAVRTIASRLTGEVELYRFQEMQDLDALFPMDGQRAAVAEILRRAVAADITSEEGIRLNRMLLAAALDLPQLNPSPRVITVRIWEPVDTAIQALGVQEPFFVWIKAALILGLILSSPWVFFQFWNFVASGLYPSERKYVYTYLPFSLTLFFLGAALAFFFVFEPVLDFLFSFNLAMNINAVPRLNEWVGFVLFLPIGFGVSFQLPLVMLLLERIGVFTVETFVSKWRIAILVIFALSMFLTPADPMSMLLMGVPLSGLYFGGILLCKYMPKRKSPLGEGYDP